MPERMDYLSFIVAGIRNKPGRNFATLFCFAFIAANIFSGQFLMAGASGGIDRGISRMGADQMIVPTQYTVFLKGASPNNTFAIVLTEPSYYRINASIMEKIGRIQGVSLMTPQLYVTTLNVPALSTEPVDIFGIDSVTDFTIQPWLQKPLPTPLRPGDIIVGHGIADNAGPQIRIGNRTYQIAGRLDPTQSPLDHTIILRLDDAYSLASSLITPTGQRITPGNVNAILIRDSPGETPEDVEDRIKRLLASSPEYRYISIIGRHFSLDPAAEDVQAIPGILSTISLFIIIITLPLIALIAAMVAHERQREIGLLKSMGAKKHTIFLLVIAESLILAAAGGITGVAISFFALLLMNAEGMLNSAFQVSFRMPQIIEIASMAGLALLAVVALGSLSSLWPAYRSSTMSPYDAIRGETK